MRDDLFVAEYLISLNAADAARKAGYSARTAKSRGYEMLKKPEIKAAIKAAMDARAERTQITQDRVLQEYARLGLSDMRRLMEWGPDGVKLKASTEIADDDAACVAEVVETKSETGGSLKLKVHDKKGALDSLARHLGMFVDRTEHTGPGGGPIETRNLSKAEADQRIAELLAKVGPAR